MGGNGSNIVDGFNTLRRFCRELHQLLKTADGQMADDDWQPMPRASVLGYTSTTLEEYDWWLPIEFVRHYKDVTKRRRHVTPYIAVLLDDPEESGLVTGTLVSAGWIDYGLGNPPDKPDRNNYYWLCRWHLWMPNREDNGKLCLDQNPRQTWQGEKLPGRISKVTSLAYPLDHITTTEALRSKIVEPLLDGIALDYPDGSSRASRAR